MDPLRNTLQSMYTNTKSCWNTIDEMGGDTSKPHNIQNLAEAIRSIPTGPSLKGLKRALDKGTAQQDYPIGMELADQWDGKNNPLIIGTYATVTASDGQKYLAVGLTRKYMDPTAQKFGSDSSNVNYPESVILPYLNSTYLDKCSDELKSVVSTVKVPWYDNSSMQQIEGTVHLFSMTEVYGVGTVEEGEAWEYWKNKTGFTSPSNGNTTGRQMADSTGASSQWWLRTYSTSSNVRRVDGSGAIAASGPGSTYGVVPQFYITASEPLTLSGLKAALNDGTAQAKYPVGAEIPDTYDGQDNPLIVAQYLDSANNSGYNEAEGVILIRKFVEPTDQVFGANVDYSVSAIKNFLDTTYLDNCSDILKSIISPIAIPYYNGSGIVPLPDQKWFLMSDREVQSNLISQSEGFGWNYWIEKTGFTSPSTAANVGRVMKDRAGSGQNVWLRSRYQAGRECIVVNTGLVDASATNVARGVLPACFIGKD